MVKIESPDEFQFLLGSKVMEVDILSSHSEEEPYCAKEEVKLDCWAPKKGHLEVRIYINEDGDLCIYTD